MSNFEIDITDLEDIKANNNFVTRSEVEKLARAHLAAGGHVLIKRSYTNALPDNLQSFTNVEQFDYFWKTLFPRQIKQVPKT